jgi:phage terminase large subunit GpA-like protein
MVWEKISPNQRNEPLDLRNYALAALNILNPSFDALEKRLKQKGNGSVSTSNSKSRRKKKRRGVVNKGVSV